MNLDYGQMPDLFVAKRINKVRIWVYTWFKSHASGAPATSASPSPAASTLSTPLSTP